MIFQGGFHNLCIYHFCLYKRLSTIVNSQTCKYQYSERPHPAHAVPLLQKTEDWCAVMGHSITRLMLFTEGGKNSSDHYIGFIPMPLLTA
jgi:hypothetical protein